MLFKKKYHSDVTLSPIKIITLSFIAVIFIGTCFLMLPISSKNGQSAEFIDALFTATSATCVTGLVVFDTFHQWTVFGQFIILTLIQIGGLGLVTLTTFFTTAFGKKLGFKTMQIAQESISFNSMADIGSTVKKVVLFSICFELIGAFVLSFVFVPQYGADGIFISIFLAISAFCNAGFDILGFMGEFSSLTGYYNNPLLIFTISILIVVGGLGFVVWNDLYNFKKTKRLLLHTKIVLVMYLTLIISGTLIVMVFEFKNKNTIGDFTVLQKFLNSFFHSVSTRTAGFNTFDTSQMFGITKLLSIVFMFIGASPGSTGGGIKVTTIAVILMTVTSLVTGNDETIILKRKVSKSIVYKSISIFTIAILVVFISFLGLYFFNTDISVATPVNLLFESVSAFATVGISVGVTATLNNITKTLFVCVMLIGRVGALSIFIAIFKNTKTIDNKTHKISPSGLVIV
ncbi:MAG: TrkH family potassium uptake protein [Oscillospiraceae bacterium]